MGHTVAFNEIVKVTKPIASDDPRQPWLIYNRSKSLVKHAPDADVPHGIKMAMGDRIKAHVLAKVRNGNIVKFGGIVSGETW